MIPDEVEYAAGAITKEEELVRIEHSVIPGTLVLESSHPYPGYHGTNVPETMIPNDIYLVTRFRYEGEDILRKARKIKHVLHDRFETTFGQVEIASRIYPFIRVKNLDCFKCVDRVQKAFEQEGIEFCRRKNIDGQGLIRIQRLFSFRKVTDHIFVNSNNPLVHYFEIPCRPDWEFFKKITYYIRGNINKYSFDAALGFVYLDELHDLVRIFGKGLTVDQLIFIREKYLYELEHPDHLEC
jgi:hypothetical protein